MIHIKSSSFATGNYITKTDSAQGIEFLFLFRTTKKDRKTFIFQSFSFILLYRICSVFCICYFCIYFCLLSISVFEEVCCNLWEQCICQHILILLAVLCTLFAECIQLVWNQIGWAACDHFCIFSDYFFLYFWIKRFCCCSIFSRQYIFCLFCCHLVAFSHQHVEYCLSTNDLRRRCNKRRLSKVFTHTRYFFQNLIEFIFCSLLF